VSSVLEQLASALGRNDEQPNVELPEKLAANPDKATIAELVAVLKTGPAAVANDAIKVLYELGEGRPELIAEYADAFFAALLSKNNRLVWGGMTALDTIATASAPALAKRLPEILAAADKGSVIANDKAVSILAKLVAAGHGDKALPALLAKVEAAAVNQLPMYAEMAAPVIDRSHQAAFTATITKRLQTIDQPSKRARLEKLLRKLAKSHL
jgi:hypothetical protein